jgi:hypothetical protein
VFLNSKNFQDVMMVLEDESGKCYQTKYLIQKIGLNARWRRFSIAHNLMKGDVVFRSVDPSKIL